MARDKAVKGHALKDKKISLLSKQKVSGDLGSHYEYKPLPGGENIWAYYKHTNVEVVDRPAETIDYKIDALFKINWRDDLDHTVRVRFRGQDYEVNHIDDGEGYKQDITLYVSTIENN